MVTLAPRSPTRLRWLFLCCAALAFLPPAGEALTFLHDRYVVWQDFACLETELQRLISLWWAIRLSSLFYLVLLGGVIALVWPVLRRPAAPG